MQWWRAVMSAGLALGLLEGALRGREVLQGWTPTNRAIREQVKRMYRDERPAPQRFGHRPNATATLERGPYQFTFISNGDGLRETRDYDALEWSVIFLGDSIVEGSSVENHETMDAVFEERTGIVALNFGLGSANTIQEYYWLASRYRPSYRTALIVLGFCLNDFEQNEFLRAFDERRGDWRVDRYVRTEEVASGIVPPADSLQDRLKSAVRSSRALYGAWGLLRRWTIGPADFWRAQVVTESQRIHTMHALKRLNQFARDIGAELVVVIFPAKSQLARSYREGGRMQDVLIALLNQEGIPYLDLHQPLQRAYQTQPDVKWYYDEIHPYKPGHRLIGELLAQELPRMFPTLQR